MNAPVEIDRTDRRILAELQADAGRPISEVAEAINLSTNACWRRIKRLEEAGVIRKRVALLDAQKLGVGMTVFVSVRADVHSETWLDKFSVAVRDMPEIVEFHRLSGEVDYMLKILVADVAHYDRVYKSLIRTISIADVSASFSMEQIKATTSLPLNI